MDFQHFWFSPFWYLVIYLITVISFFIRSNQYRKLYKAVKTLKTVSLQSDKKAFEDALFDATKLV